MVVGMLFVLSLSSANAQQQQRHTPIRKAKEGKEMSRDYLRQQNQTDIINLTSSPSSPRLNQEKKSAVFFDMLNITADVESDIISGKLLLFDLEFTEDVYTDVDEIYSGQVRGSFCRLSMDEQKDDPSKGKRRI